MKLFDFYGKPLAWTGKPVDFEKKFIRAEVVSFGDFKKYGSFEKAKENGKLRLEGKDYLVKDGDVLFFRVNP